MSIEPEDWKPQEPPADFADRVMARLGEEERASMPPARRKGRLRVAIAGALALAAALAFVAGRRSARLASRGELTAAAREEAHLGERAIAVLEPGARVAWNGDEVTQPAGDVFYRVERGGPFRVHTPSGDVRVLGTCFRVRVEDARGGSEGDSMKIRDVKVAAVGAAVGASALVTVYEGKVALSQPGHASRELTLTAGESGRADGRGVAAADVTRKGESESSPLVAANANLADAVREYKRRLEAIEAKKTDLDEQLADAQKRLTATQGDGAAAPPEPVGYDLSAADWKRLAEEGSVRARFPCMQPNKWDEGLAEKLQGRGDPPEYAAALKKAMAASRARTWAVIRPLCANALGGDAAAADRLGASTCQGLVQHAAESSGVDVGSDFRTVALINAGAQPMPSDGGDAVVKMMLALTGESSVVEQEVAAEIGPTDAKRLVYGDDPAGCWSSNSWTSTPQAKLPP